MRAWYSVEEPPLSRKAFKTVETSSRAAMKSPVENPNPADMGGNGRSWHECRSANFGFVEVNIRRGSDIELTAWMSLEPNISGIISPEYVDMV